jgi:hypothetical protein
MSMSISSAKQSSFSQWKYAVIYDLQMIFHTCFIGKFILNLCTKFHVPRASNKC